MTSPTIIEAAEKALQDFPHEHIIADDYSYMAEALIAAVTPLIRAAALEEAAAAAETRDLGDNSAQDGLAQEIAVAIRALAGRPADPT
jgi:hypothetical protein